MWNQAGQELLAARAGFDLRWLFHLTVKDRTTGEAVRVGMWTGKTAREFDIGAGPEVFAGMFGALVPPVISSEPGNFIRKTEVRFVGLTDTAKNVLQGYEPRLAPATLWQVLFDTDGNFVDQRRRFKGFVNEAPQFPPAVNGVSSATVSLVSTARRGTGAISAKKSDGMQQRRGGDRFRRYGSLGQVVSDVWGNP